MVVVVLPVRMAKDLNLIGILVGSFTKIRRKLRSYVEIFALFFFHGHLLFVRSGIIFIVVIFLWSGFSALSFFVVKATKLVNLNINYFGWSDLYLCSIPYSDRSSSSVSRSGKGVRQCHESCPGHSK